MTLKNCCSTGKLYHGDLSKEDDGRGKEQSLAAFEMKGAASGLEGTGIEQIEEMGHDKDGEKQRKAS